MYKYITYIYKYNKLEHPYPLHTVKILKFRFVFSIRYDRLRELKSILPYKMLVFKKSLISIKLFLIEFSHDFTSNLINLSSLIFILFFLKLLCYVLCYDFFHYYYCVMLAIILHFVVFQVSYI